MLALVNFTEHVAACARPFVYCSVLAVLRVCARSFAILVHSSLYKFYTISFRFPFRLAAPSTDHIVPHRSLSIRFRRSKVVQIVRTDEYRVRPSCSDHKHLNYRNRRWTIAKKKRKIVADSRDRENQESTTVKPYSVVRFTLVYDPESQVRLFGTIDVHARARARQIESVLREVIFRVVNFLPPLPIAVGPQTQWRKWLKPVHGQTASRRSLKRSRLSPWSENSVQWWKAETGNYVTIEQMSGVGCVEPKPRLSAPWYSNIDVALMGIQSTAQFVEKYHHIIGEFFFFQFFIHPDWDLASSSFSRS